MGKKLSNPAALGKAGKVDKPYGKKIACNKRFRTVHKVTYPGGTKASPHTRAVRDVEQMP